MDSYVLTLFDDAGNPIPIPAIQGVGIKDIYLEEEHVTHDIYAIVLEDDRIYRFVVRHGENNVRIRDFAPNEHAEGYVGDLWFELPSGRMYICTRGMSRDPSIPSEWMYEWKQLEAVRLMRGAPTTETFGNDGDVWVDTQNKVIYVCLGGGMYADGVYYEWVRLTPEKLPNPHALEISVGTLSEPVYYDGTAPVKIRIPAIPGVGIKDGVDTADKLYAAAAAGGVISLAPDADITVSQMLDLPEGTVILGNGATIRRAAGFEEGMFNLSSGCRLENFTIDGNRSAMVKPTWDKTYEVNMKTDAQGCVVENITINNGNEGIIVSGYDNIVRGCKLYDLGGNGIHFGAAYRCIAEDCTVIGANKNASAMGNSRGCIYICRKVEDVDIINCYCEDGLAGVGGVDGPDDAHIKILGCTAKNCTAAIEGTYVASGGPVDVVISDNQFIDCGDIELLNRGFKYPPGDGLVISGNLFTNAGIHLQGFRNVTITGNTVRGGWIRADECPYCLISGNVVDCLNDAGIYVRYSSNASISGNSVRNKGMLVYASYCPRLLISGNTLRQKSGSTTTAECIKLNYSPEAAIDNNKMFLYSGNGIMSESNCRTMGNYIVVADSSQIAIRVWGGNKNYVVAQNMSNGTYAIATATSSVIQNNITIESTAFVDVTYTLTNITTDGFAKALTDDDFEFTLTAADGYSLPDAITVTMGGTALAADTGYAYDKATGKVTVYRVSGAVEVTGGVV